MLAVELDAGPPSPPAAKPRSGFSTTRPWRFTIDDGAASEHRHTIEFELERELEADLELRYTVFPVFGASGELDWQGEGFAATGFALDLLLDDGSRLSGLGAVDQHGIGLTAGEQGASKSLAVDQWNRKTVDLGRLHGRRVVAAECVVRGAPGARVEGWFEVSVAPRSRPERGHPADWVLTTRGTHSSAALSRGNTLPATAMPNAFAMLTPVTDARDGAWMYRYHRDVDELARPTLQAFAVAHSPTPWLGDYGVIQFFPRPGLDRPIGVPLAFDRADELARPHRYEVTFADGTTARLAPTVHAGIATFTFPAADGCVAFDRLDDGAIDLDPGGRWMSGYSDHAGAGESTRVYFAAEFDRAVRDARAGALQFELPAGEPVTMRIATSLIGIEQARHNLRLELSDTDDVDSVAERAREAWDAVLDRIAVEGASDDRLVTLYSNLYRLFLYPNLGSENAGTAEQPRLRYASLFEPQPRPHSPTETGRHVRDGTIYLGNGFWDTYRTTWPAYVLLAPELVPAMLDGFVQHYRDGGWMARWSAPGYTDCMVGTSSDIVLADAAAKGIPLLDPVDAYDSALKNATVPSDDPRVGRKGLGSAIFRGYVDAGIPEGMSWSLENAINDFGIATLSERMLGAASADDPRRAEYAANARYFRGRAASHGLLFDADSGFFRGRTADGGFTGTAFDPAIWGGDYTETNAWGMAFSVPHDPAGLAALHGGPAGLRRALDAFFATNETACEANVGEYGRIIHEMVEARNVRLGMLGLSNQPAHHIPFQYLFAGAPHRTQHLTREAIERLFLGSEIGQGYPGDEDNGEMSAWYLFAALGLYPLEVGTPRYALTAPLYRRARVRVGPDRHLVIEALEASPRNRYIQRVWIDGREWTSPFVDHEVLVRGATIRFELGPEPSEWGAVAGLERGHPSRALVPHVDVATPARSSDLSAAAVLLDDDSGEHVAVEDGFWIECELERATTVELFTITAGEDPGAAPATVTVEGLRGGEWIEVGRVGDVRFRWPRQTRAYLVDAPAPCTAYRVRFGRGTLAQVELLGEHPLPLTHLHE